MRHDHLPGHGGKLSAELLSVAQQFVLWSVMSVLSPIESEFATTEEAEVYDRWFRAKVDASLRDTRPSILHDQVMAEMDAMLAEVEQRRRT